jgi:hypothetical protein
MRGNRLQAIAAERVDARVGPNVGAIAAETAQVDIVSVRVLAGPEDADELVLRTVEWALAGVRLVPDHEIQHGAIELASDVDQIADVAPVHAYEMDRAFGRDANAVGERLREEPPDMSMPRPGLFSPRLDNVACKE